MLKTLKLAALSATSPLAVIAASPSLAQDASGGETRIEQVGERNFAEIVVTAQRRAERILDVPIAITVASPEQLERQQVNTISDLARVAPSLEIQQAPGQSVGGGGQIRGIGTQSFQQGAVGSVGIVVDGVSQGNVNIADLFDIARVEVLKGPQGTLFGLTTSAGVINISTTTPEFGKFSVRARTELSKAGTAGSQFGRQLFQGVVNVPIAANAAMRVSGNANLTQGTNRNALTGKYDPHRTYGGRARLLWEPTQTLRVNLIGDYTKVDDDGIDFFTLYRGDNGAITTPAGPAYNPNNDTISQAASCGITIGGGNRDYCTTEMPLTRSHTWGTSLQVDYDGGPLSVTSITAYRDQDSTQGLNIFRLDPHMPHILQGPATSEIKLFTQELRFATPSGSTVEFTGGLFLSMMDQFNPSAPFGIHVHAPFGIIPIVATNTNNVDVSNDSMAVFGQGTFRLTPQFRLIAGGRFTAERLGVESSMPDGVLQFFPKANIENFSWRTGAQYEFNRELMAFATVSRGYKGSQIALPAPNAPPGTPPTIIRPEIPTAYEVGVKANALGGQVGMELSGFYSDIKDYQGQQCVPVPPSPTSPGGGINCQPENISGVVSKGVEFSMYGRPTKSLTLNLGAMWNSVTYPDGFRGQDGSDLGGQQLQSAPEWKVTASGEFAQPIGRAEAFLAADAVYKSEIRLAASTDPGAIYGGHVNIGGRLGVRGGDGAWTVAVFARNLTNNHEPVIRFLNFPDGTAGIGQILTTQSFRQVGLSLDARF